MHGIPCCSSTELRFTICSKIQKSIFAYVSTQSMQNAPCFSILNSGIRVIIHTFALYRQTYSVFTLSTKSVIHPHWRKSTQKINQIEWVSRVLTQWKPHSNPIPIQKKSNVWPFVETSIQQWYLGSVRIRWNKKSVPKLNGKIKYGGRLKLYCLRPHHYCPTWGVCVSG